MLLGVSLGPSVTVSAGASAAGGLDSSVPQSETEIRPPSPEAGPSAFHHIHTPHPPSPLHRPRPQHPPLHTPHPWLHPSTCLTLLHPSGPGPFVHSVFSHPQSPLKGPGCPPTFSAEPAACDAHALQQLRGLGGVAPWVLPCPRSPPGRGAYTSLFLKERVLTGTAPRMAAQCPPRLHPALPAPMASPRPHPPHPTLPEADQSGGWCPGSLRNGSSSQKIRERTPHGPAPSLLGFVGRK